MCKTKTIASKKHFFHQIIIFFVGALRSPKGSLEVPDVTTFRGSSGGVPVTSRAGWNKKSLKNSLKSYFGRKKKGLSDKWNDGDEQNNVKEGSADL